MKKDLFIALTGAVVAGITAKTIGILGVILGACVIIGLSLLTEKEDI